VLLKLRKNDEAIKAFAHGCKLDRSQIAADPGAARLCAGGVRANRAT
jgi:hypothetical protein